MSVEILNEGVTIIQMESLQLYFHVLVFIKHVVLTIQSLDEIPQCDHLNETS